MVSQKKGKELTPQQAAEMADYYLRSLLADENEQNLDKPLDDRV